MNTRNIGLRKSVMVECLKIMREKRNLCSEKYDGLMPKKGMEQQFFDQKKKCEILEDLIHALDSEPVRKALADWQKEIMKEDAAGKPHKMTI